MTYLYNFYIKFDIIVETKYWNVTKCKDFDKININYKLILERYPYINYLTI